MSEYLTRVYNARSKREEYQILREAGEEMARRINKLLDEISPKDYPILVASLEVSSANIRGMLGDSGCKIADKLKTMMVCIGKFKDD